MNLFIIFEYKRYTWTGCQTLVIQEIRLSTFATCAISAAGGASITTCIAV
jgi:hypothetical protein